MSRKVPGRAKSERSYHKKVKVPLHDLDLLRQSGLALRVVATRCFEDIAAYVPVDPTARYSARVRIASADGPGRGGEATLVFKSRRGKRHERIEVDVGRPNDVARILKRIGMRRTFCYQRYRTMLFVSSAGGATALAKYDETPVGSFLKLEGPSGAVDAVLARLGLERAVVSASYRALYHAACAARDEPPSDMLFSSAARQTRRRA